MELPPPLCIEPPAPREDVPPILPPLDGCPEKPLPRGVALSDRLPRPEGVIDLTLDGEVLREPLKMTRPLRGTPVEMNPLEWVTPIPAKVRP